MLDKIKIWAEDGMKLPFAFDAVTKLPSVTLFFMYLANALAIISLIVLLIIDNKFQATITICIFAIIQTILYMIRKLHKVKFDLDDKSVELESDNNDENSK